MGDVSQRLVDRLPCLRQRQSALWRRARQVRAVHAQQLQ